MPYGKILKEARLEKGYTLTQVASVAGVSVPYLSDIENFSNRSLRTDKIKKVCEFLGGDLNIVLNERDRNRGWVKIYLDENNAEEVLLFARKRDKF